MSWGRKAGTSVVGLALLLAGCSSTESDDATPTGGARPSTTSPQSSVAAGADPGASAASVPPGGGGDRSSTAKRSSRAPAPGVLRDVPSAGITDTEIKVGVDVIHFDDVVIPGVTRGPTKDFAKAVIDDLNSRGGAAGRRIVPVYHDYKGTTFVQDEPGACAHYGEDAKVAVVIGQSYGHSEDFLDCLAKHNILFIEGGRLQHDDDSMAAHPAYVNAGWIEMTRGARVLARALVEQGFFGPGTVVGILGHDEPIYRRALEDLKAALASHGVAVKKVVLEDRLMELHEYPVQARSSAVQMKEAGVNRLILASASSAFFPDAAEAQNYHPRYGLSTDVFPEFILLLTTVKSQLRGAAGVGWVPMADVSEHERWPAWNRCLEVMAKAGVTTSDSNAERGGLVHCEVGWLLAAGAERAGTRLTPVSLLAGIESLGTAFESPATPAVRLGPGRHDGPDAVRWFGYFDDCQCFRYTTGSKVAA